MSDGLGLIHVECCRPLVDRRLDQPRAIPILNDFERMERCIAA